MLKYIVDCSGVCAHLFRRAERAGHEAAQRARPAPAFQLYRTGYTYTTLPQNRLLTYYIATEQATHLLHCHRTGYSLTTLPQNRLLTYYIATEQATHLLHCPRTGYSLTTMPPQFESTRRLEVPPF
jgi:hypothetical protein